MSKHILFLTDNFPPESNAPASRTFEHAKVWVEKGAKVTVITTAPNFPEGVVFDGYKNSWFSRESMEGIDVWRVKTYVTANNGFVKRILDYLSFMISGSFAAMFVKRPDVVVATSPQFFTAVSGWFVSVCRRVPFVFELRDIWPASITAVGAMQKSKAILLLEKLEMFLYRRADSIISVTQSFKDELIGRDIEGSKIDVILNGVEIDKYEPQSRNEGLAKQYDLQGKFVVGYVGTHGMAHALESILNAAELLKSRDDIVFMFAGSGAMLEKLQAIKHEKKLNNVVFLGRMNKSDMPAVWSLCSVSLVHLKNVPLFKSVIPSKIFESMAMGLPIVMAVPEGEATSIIETNDVGVIVEPENPAALAETVRSLADNHEKMRTFSENARRSSMKFDRKSLAVKMLHCLEDVVKRGKK